MNMQNSNEYEYLKDKTSISPCNSPFRRRNSSPNKKGEKAKGILLVKIKERKNSYEYTGESSIFKPSLASYYRPFDTILALMNKAS